MPINRAMSAVGSISSLPPPVANPRDYYILWAVLIVPPPTVGAYSDLLCPGPLRLDPQGFPNIRKEAQRLLNS